MPEPYRVTFVCTGNICRSPMAEQVLRHHAEEEGLDVEIDSSGTGGWHIGDGADHRAVRTLTDGGYRSAHSARQFEPLWFGRYDLIVALDQSHLEALRSMAPDADALARVRLLREFDPDAEAGGDLDVPDPYFGDDDGFVHVLGLIEAAVPGLLETIREGLKERR
ncbi:low molecular weight protein-tyrosine-phosphatase [Actinomadura sp. HBU206391]|uniref:low molecular weight protein-tyrosine-phosphatase n=1 Tax=Actinomadura sp. HBU206391 TaxID=2731692 RepID=UPI0016507272|nr:low molecular weight protein-tyrosine-phosphatase [Actinomadura sp. HBU206391]MBC6458479.1 low molecular weight phosphotyrosine protein phosphatase [Actinomadura sp. HBU206391]